MTGMAISVALAAASATAPAIPRDESIEKQVEQTLARMTLDEKIGQMTELAIDLICHRGPDGKLVYHPGMLDSIIGKYKVGSILNAPQHSLTPQEWNEVIGKIQEASMREIGIPCIYPKTNEYRNGKRVVKVDFRRISSDFAGLHPRFAPFFNTLISLQSKMAKVLKNLNANLTVP